MRILIIDDDLYTQQLLTTLLRSAGYEDLHVADSALAAFSQLKLDQTDRTNGSSNIDLILTDLSMDGVDGLEAIQRIKKTKHLQDIPIIVVTGRTEPEYLQAAFDAGATDYITKPLNKLELLARVRSALRLKREMDQRKDREQELLEVTRKLVEANQILQQISTRDGLTGIANRRRFDEILEVEWKRAMRTLSWMSLIMIDIDVFKLYNDALGHLRGDDCLKQVAKALDGTLRRSTDLLARYGGEEFAAILPGTDLRGAGKVAERLRERVLQLNIPHPDSPVSQQVTISLGVAAAIPQRNSLSETLIAAADRALYRAKQAGRNRIEFAGPMVENRHQISVDS